MDDSSPDGTGEVAEDLATENPKRVSVIHRAGKQGLRTAYLDGFRAVLRTDVDAIVQMDADFSHDPSMLVPMAEMLTEMDVVLGSRYIPGGSVDERWPVWRKSLSGFGNVYARTILNIPLQDVTTGYRIWRRQTLVGMPLDRVRASGYIFQVEMAYLAYCLEYKVGEVPIHFADRRLGKSKMSFSIQAEAAVRVWQVLWNYRDLRKRGVKARVTSNGDEV